MKSLLNLPFGEDSVANLSLVSLICIQILRYDDLEKLGQRRWIVVEFLFEHRDEESSIFKCDFSIEPAQGENRESHFSSQNISIVKKFSTSGVSP